jgi:hypothetical protein
MSPTLLSGVESVLAPQRLWNQFEAFSRSKSVLASACKLSDPWSLQSNMVTSCAVVIERNDVSGPLRSSLILLHATATE